MRIIKRLAVILSLIAVTMPSLSADEGVKLHIHFKSGEKMELDFADRPTISFNSRDALKIQSASMSMKVKAFSTVDKITFDDQTGIADAISADKQIKAESSKKVTLSGFKAGTKVNVIGINGVIYLTAKVDNEDRFELSLDELEPGAYVIAADNELCKLMIN